jgi:hypothetical protein
MAVGTAVAIAGRGAVAAGSRQTPDECHRLAAVVATLVVAIPQGLDQQEQHQQEAVTGPQRQHSTRIPHNGIRRSRSRSRGRSTSHQHSSSRRSMEA